MITSWRQDAAAGITFPEGFVAGGARGGLKTEGNDVALIVCDGPASVAGVFTTNRVHASCVRYSRAAVAQGKARAIVCNAGNANACNGEQGDLDTISTAEIVGRELGIAPQTVLVASTGVIGRPMPMAKLETGIVGAAQVLDRDAETDMQVARAIMTTDLRPKQIAVEVTSDEWSGPVRIGAVCKGSGMIAPNMATMLCFVTTDAAVPSPLLQDALGRAVTRTFNRVTVDTDTSTNDMVLALAAGSGPVSVQGPGPAFEDLCQALERACRYLAKEIARDGEGATKLVEVAVRGALTEEDAVQVARTVAESPLVKTALFGKDPNWGRILAAAGRAGVPFDPGATEAWLGDIVVFQNGCGAEFDALEAHEYLAAPEVKISLDLHCGQARASVWTCDYSYDYIRINAEYHT